MGKQRRPSPRPLTPDQERAKNARIVAAEARRIVRTWRRGEWEGFTGGHHVVPDGQPAGVEPTEAGRYWCRKLAGKRPR